MSELSQSYVMPGTTNQKNVASPYQKVTLAPIVLVWLTRRPRPAFAVFQPPLPPVQLYPPCAPGSPQEMPEISVQLGAWIRPPPPTT